MEVTTPLRHQVRICDPSPSSTPEVGSEPHPETAEAQNIPGFQRYCSCSTRKASFLARRPGCHLKHHPSPKLRRFLFAPTLDSFCFCLMTKLEDFRAAAQNVKLSLVSQQVSPQGQATPRIWQNPRILGRLARSCALERRAKNSAMQRMPPEVSLIKNLSHISSAGCTI